MSTEIKEVVKSKYGQIDSRAGGSSSWWARPGRRRRLRPITSNLYSASKARRAGSCPACRWRPTPHKPTVALRQVHLRELSRVPSTNVKGSAPLR